MKQFNLYDEKAVNRLKQAHALGEREKVIDVVNKHPISLIIVFIVTILAYVIVLVAIYFLMPAVSENDSQAAYRTTSFAAFIMAIVVGVVLVVATFLYMQTKFIISSENLIQIMQKDLLYSKTSRLALTDIEDVTVVQHGLLANLFDYGSLVVETAGEQANFTFNYCPRPHYVAKELIDTKEEFVSGNDTYKE